MSAQLLEVNYLEEKESFENCVEVCWCRDLYGFSFDHLVGGIYGIWL